MDATAAGALVGQKGAVAVDAGTGIGEAKQKDVGEKPSGSTSGGLSTFGGSSL